jgi:hypothetical protein
MLQRLKAINKRKLVLVIILILIAIQAIRIDKTNPRSDSSKDFITVLNPPQEIASILSTSCYDCHSNQSKYPWYTNIAPVSWWIKDHINEAREELNFSVWEDYSDKRKKHKLEECFEMIEEGEMPLTSYTIIHNKASLNENQKKLLIDWFKTMEQNQQAESK